MGMLIKNAVTTYIPGNPGNPGSPYVPAQPARTVVEEVTVCAPSYQSFPLAPVPSDSLVFGSGGSVYVPEIPAGFGGIQTSGYGQVTCTTESVLVYYPATAAVAAVPYEPPTAAQLAVSLNQGWNSHSRTIGELDVGSYIEFTVKLGTYAALMAVGPFGMGGALVGQFKHGIVVDAAGARIFENGSVVAVLAGSNAPGMPIRIMRLVDGRIAYSAGGAAYISTVEDYTVLDNLFIYGMLYSAYDEVSSAEFFAGADVAEPSVRMGGAGEVIARVAARATMAGSGVLLASIATAVVMSGQGSLDATLSAAADIEATMGGNGYLVVELESSGRGSVVLPSVLAFGSDEESGARGFGYTELPLFTVSGAEASFVPEQPTMGYINLPFMTVWGSGSETDIGQGSVSLPLFAAQASEGEYGIGAVTLPQFVGAASGGFIADDALLLVSNLVAISGHAAQYDLVLVLNSAGELASSMTLTREQALALLSALQQSSLFSTLGVYGMSMQSGLRTASLSAMNIGTQADLAPGAVWVVNLDTSASVQYEGYGFNSFFQRGNDYYGVANDGIYKLAGDTDAGAPIDSLVEFARSNLGATQSKHLPEIYLAASSDGALMLKVVTEGSTNYYRARSSSADVRNHLVKPGKGLDSVYWQFTLLNENGNDFNVAGLEFMPAVTKRRI